MANLQMLFPIEPKEFWQKLKAIVEQVLMEHANMNLVKEVPPNNKHPRLLRAHEVCSIFQISKPTLYDWMKQGKLESIKIQSRRFFKWEDIDKLIERGRQTLI